MKKHLFINLLLIIILVASFMIDDNDVSAKTNYSNTEISSNETERIMCKIEEFKKNLEKEVNRIRKENYSTDDLIDIILEELQTTNIYLFNDLNQGVSYFKGSNPFYQVFKERTECFGALLDKYKQIDLEKADDVLCLYNYWLEILLSQKEIFNKANEEEALEYMRIIEEKNEAKKHRNYPYNEVSIKLSSDNYNANNNYSNRTLGVPYTPNGNEVDYATLFSGNDFTNAQINAIIAAEDLEYPNLIRESNPTKKYNCHSYAWYSQDTDNNEYWIDLPTSYIDDDSYTFGNGEIDEILCYKARFFAYYNEELMAVSGEFITHSAIITYVGSNFDLDDANTYDELEVISKWGSQSLILHNAVECPYTGITPYVEGGITYYEVFSGYLIFEPRTNDAYTLAQYSAPISNSFSVNGNSNDITDKYEMYELNVEDYKEYEMEISSSYPLDIRLYDSNMNIIIDDLYNDYANGTYSVSIDTYLLSGRYYLRVAYQNISYSGTITINVEGHTHSYGSPYLWVNYTQHFTNCVCGEHQLQGHAVASGSFSPGQQYATCLLCNGLASIGLIGPESSNNYPHTSNGSFILPNGVIIINAADLNSYLNGTLVFIDPNIYYLSKYNVPPFLFRRKE